MDGVELKVHKVVLSARSDYFQSMFHRGWFETHNSDTKTVLNISVPSKLLNFILDYLYSDNVHFKNPEDIELISNVLVTADQFLLPRLISICEIALTNVLTLKNVGEVFAFAYSYRAIQLKEACCQFIIQNLVYILENGILEDVPDEAMDELSEYYRNVLPHGRTYDQSRSEKVIKIEEEVKKFNLENPTTFEEILMEEEEESRSRARKKSGKKRRNSSGSCGSGASSGDRSSLDELILLDDFDDKLSLDDFTEIHEKVTHDVIDDVTNHGDYNDNEVLPNDNNNHKDFLANFFKVSPDKKSTNGGTSNKSSNKMTPMKKLSQKERRKLQQNQQITTSDDYKSPKMNENKWSGWAKSPESSVINMSDIMNQESQKLNHSSSISAASPRSVNSKSSGGKVTSWRSLSLNESTDSIIKSPPTAKNPWKIIESPKTVDFPSLNEIGGGGLKDILVDETKKSENLMRAKSKALSSTVTEEKAIEELKSFYGADNIFDERITVQRVNANQPTATPIWRRFN